MKTALVITTINKPTIAQDFCDNFEKFGHTKDESAIIIIGDRKSPNEESQAIADGLKARGFDVQYYDIPSQEKWLQRFPEFAAIIPYNTDNRRNIGYVMAKEQGAGAIITVDDDNYPLPDVDFLGGHVAALGERKGVEIVKSANGWFNICDMMTNDGGAKIFPRGFPYKSRKDYEKNELTYRTGDVRVMLNEGLWTNDPDVDAVTHLASDVRMIDLKEKKSLVLDLGTFSPINSQNTMFHIDLLPAYYFVLMGEKIDGLALDRYGDIWQGLFMKKVMDTLGVYAAFGTPLAAHRRNSHNYFKDLKMELNGIIYTETIAEFLEQSTLKGANASEAYADLTAQLAAFVANDPRFGDDVKAFMEKIRRCQMVWLETLEKVRI
jgi:hypothetical protein